LSHKTIIEAHTIEKGLTLPVPKPHFGHKKIIALLNMNKGWTPPEGDLSRSMLVGALRDYQKTFAKTPTSDTGLAERISAFVASHDAENALGGVRQGVRHAGENPAAMVFLQSRFSAREFGDRALTDDEVTDVVALAQRAPSQCNRQSTRLHVYRDPARIRELLALQGGARGFAENVPTLFVVTSEITAWGGPQQRNQPYIDGGLYAMMLMLGLDAKGFLSCPLNLAIKNRTERTIKSAGDIPARERLVVMIAAGTQPEHAIRAANSPRRGMKDVCRLHD
jgi:nitroreductase